VAHLGGFSSNDPNYPDLSSHFIAVTQTPAPPGLMLALAGIGSLGLGGVCRFWRRRVI
jgi:hypothetical protein